MPSAKRWFFSGKSFQFALSPHLGSTRVKSSQLESIQLDSVVATKFHRSRSQVKMQIVLKIAKFRNQFSRRRESMENEKSKKKKKRQNNQTMCSQVIIMKLRARAHIREKKIAFFVIFCIISKWNEMMMPSLFTAWLGFVDSFVLCSIRCCTFSSISHNWVLCGTMERTKTNENQREKKEKKEKCWEKNNSRKMIEKCFTKSKSKTHLHLNKQQQHQQQQQQCNRA